MPATAAKTPKPARKLAEQQNVCRTGGQFKKMDKCEHCGNGGVLEPAFGGDASHGADLDPVWDLMICQKCAKAAEKRISVNHSGDD